MRVSLLRNSFEATLQGGAEGGPLPQVPLDGGVICLSPSRGLGMA